jgi:type II secretory pathway component PulC
VDALGVLKLIIKKYPWVFMAPLIGGIILVGVSTGYTMYRALSYNPPAVPETTEEDMKAPESRPLLDHYAVISQRDLFASALSGAEERVEAKQAKTRAPTVSFKLMGTVVVSSGVSAAIIEDPATREQELFHENDMVQGVRIVKILRNKVIVDKDGYEEVVEVVEEPPKTTASPVQQPRRVQRPPVRRPVKVQPSIENPHEP